MNEETLSLSTVDDILKAALSKEKASFFFYDNLLKNRTVAPLREILEHLREEEYKHIRLIEKKIARMEMD